MRFRKQTTESKGFASINQWYQSETGEYLLAELEDRLNPLLVTTFGYYSLQIGCPDLSERLQANCRVKHQFTLDNESAAEVEATPSMLPIETFPAVAV